MSEELFAQIIEQVEDAQNRIDRELKNIVNLIRRMYEDGRITDDVGVELSEKIDDIRGML